MRWENDPLSPSGSGRRNMAMKRILLLTVATLLLGLLLGSAVLAQGTTEMTAATVMETTPAGDLAPSGGPAILLPVAALLLGSGVLTYAILRRRL
jgi:hypothetical protein